MSATEQLDERIRELVLRGDVETIVRLVASARAIATACELENAALREFVAGVDTWLEEEDAEGWCSPSAGLANIRQRLATDHGLPLPESPDV